LNEAALVRAREEMQDDDHNVWVQVEVIDDETGDCEDVQLPHKVFMLEDADPDNLQTLSDFMLLNLPLSEGEVEESVDGARFLLRGQS
jgi:hypothetical protein